MAPLSPRTDRRIVELALAEGLVAPDALRALDRELAARRARGEPVKSLAETLCEEGLLEWINGRALLDRVRSAPEEALPDRGTIRRLGQYALLDELGRGGMGSVHRARHLPTGALRAVKLLSGGADV